ncbi:hypothetical protein F889_00923 [Acinetobacter colistiniresistens]|uniref:Lipoprotein n=1 Tax=Acinetobacter colistiniresistens TaxID=280145 RepID=N9QYU4_9GAMM|nr:hypothetical protein [Acinetobacter colistiniresistens]ENX35256.1 hypothetical protein F889_00923 [Acinetobacter colistiniresistens]
MNKFFLIVPSLILLSSCASVYKLNDAILNQGTRYTEPTTGKTANVRVFYGLGKNIRIYPNSSTKAEIKNDMDKGDAFTSVKTSGMFGAAKFEYAPKTLGMPNTPKYNLDYGEFKVPAGRPILLSMSYSYNNGARSTFCNTQLFRTEFEENKNYALAINVNSGCYYLIKEYIGDEEVSMKNIEKL